AHFVLKLLDDVGWDDPQAPFEIELFRFCQPQFTSTDSGQQQQAQTKLSLHAAPLIEPELLKHLGKLWQTQKGVMSNWWLRCCYHIQIGGWVGLHSFGDDQSIAK